MATARASRREPGNDRWSLFLRQRRLQDQLRRLRNDFKNCYCPPGCRGYGTQNHVPVDPASLPAQPLHGPYVAADSAMPQTRARPQDLRHPNLVVAAEARGTSDILLHRSGIRATLRMSLQVFDDPIGTARRGYFGEMFLTRPGQEEQFIGFIQAWHLNRSSNHWIDLLLEGWGQEQFGEFIYEMRTFFMKIYGYTAFDEELTDDRNGNTLPRRSFRQHFAAPWARLNDTNDVVFIPMIWLDEDVTGQRIIDQGFELFYRLMVGGTLPEPYNLDGPLTVLMEPGVLRGTYRSNWASSINPGQQMDHDERVAVLGRTYQRNGFMHFTTTHDDDDDEDEDPIMGRRLDPRDHPAASGDVAMVPPNPPATDLGTPSPQRAGTRRRSRTPRTSSGVQAEGAAASSSSSADPQRQLFPRGE